MEFSVYHKISRSTLSCFFKTVWRNNIIKPVNPKGNQLWIFFGRTDAEAEAPILWPPYVKSQLTVKEPDAGKDWRQEEKGTTEDEMVVWHHRLNGHKFEQTLGDGDGQGSLACCSPWGCKESDMTEWLNNNKLRTNKNCLIKWHLSRPTVLDYFLPFSMYPGNQVFYLKNTKKGKRDQIKTRLDTKDLIIVTDPPPTTQCSFCQERINSSTSRGVFKS